MPTDDDGNGESPTATDVNASQDVDVTTLTPEQIELHPHVQELKKKYSAAHSDMDKTNLSKKELQAEVARLRVLAGEEADEPKEEEPQHVTKQELKDQVWELKHAQDIEVYGDEEFQKDVANGIPKEYALNTAKLRFQSNPEHARLERQRTMASGPAMGTRNLESEDSEGFDPVEAAKWGYSKESYIKQRQLKKERGQL